MNHTTKGRHPATVLHEYTHRAFGKPICFANFAKHGASYDVDCNGDTPAEARANLRATVESDLARTQAELAIHEARLLALDAAEEPPPEMTVDELLALGPDEKWWEYRAYPDGTFHEPGWCMPDGDRHTAANLQADRANGWHDFATEAACRLHHRITHARAKLAEMEKAK